MSFEDVLTLSKDIFQIAFFVTIGILSVLTYFKARKTLLQPIRTEIFKQQLREFTDILSLFGGKGETELREDFAFEKAFRANTCYLIDQYASLFFDLEIDGEKRPYRTEECPRGIIEREGLELLDGYFADNGGKEQREKADPRTKAAIWSEYRFKGIFIPRESAEMEDRLRRIIGSPLIPADCASLLKDYMSTVHRNLTILGDLLTECARELPVKYPTIESLKQAAPYWIHRTYMQRFEHLDKKANEITEYLRGYFSVEKLME